MTSRRDLIAGIGCASAFTAAELLRPRTIKTLMPANETLDRIVPRQFGGYKEGGSGNIILPARSENTLTSRLYGDLLGRVYQTAGPELASIMLLIAYGASQTDQLQLHRPETCYPFFGYAVEQRRPFDVQVPGFGKVPAVALTAVAKNRVEDVVYWTRLGSDLPRTDFEQRRTRFAAAMRGEIQDGALIRMSAVRSGEQPLFDELAAFLRALVLSLPHATRQVLLGR